MSIGQRISELRRNYGYSQEYIAEQLQVSRQAVSKWEQDLCAPDTYNLIALAELLGVTVEYLAIGKKPEAPQETPCEAAPPPAPASPPSNTPRIAGLILLCSSLLALILGVLFSRVLIAIAVPLLLLSVLLLTVRKYLGIILSVIALVALFFLIFAATPVTVVTVTDGYGAVRTEWSIVPLLAQLFSLALLVGILVWIIVKIRHKHH